MNLINLTPHTININGIDPIPPSGSVARVSEVTNSKTELHGIEFVKKSYGEVTGLPEYDNVADLIYIVSFMVRAACPDRKDIASPGDAIRNDDGQIIGAYNLVLN